MNSDHVGNPRARARPEMREQAAEAQSLRAAKRNEEHYHTDTPGRKGSATNSEGSNCAASTFGSFHAELQQRTQGVEEVDEAFEKDKKGAKKGK